MSNFMLARCAPLCPQSPHETALVSKELNLLEIIWKVSTIKVAPDTELMDHMAMSSKKIIQIYTKRSPLHILNRFMLFQGSKQERHRLAYTVIVSNDGQAAHGYHFWTTSWINHVIHQSFSIYHPQRLFIPLRNR
jgi:hypothetical protein